MFIKIFRNLSIVFKIVVVSAILAALFLGTSFTYLLSKSRSELIESNVKLLENELNGERKIIETKTKDIEASILSISEMPAIQGIIRSKDTGFDEVDNSSLQQWEDRLQTHFEAHMKSSEAFSQLRYIDADGMEIVRVNYIAHNDQHNSEYSVEAVEDENLQNKFNRDYFQAGITFGKGEIYVTNVELNKEGNPPRISEPITGITDM